VSAIRAWVARHVPQLIAASVPMGLAAGLGAAFVAGPIAGIAAGAAVASLPLAAMRWGSRQGAPYILGGTRLDYASMVGDPSRNSIVVAVVGWIARNFPEAPVRVARVLPDGGREYIPRGMTGPGAMLRLLERPNLYMSGVLMWKAVITDLYCTGNAYIVKVRNASGRVVELWWVPKALMRPGWPADGSVFIGWYEYRPGDGLVYALREQDVIHLRDGIDPSNTRLGLSQLASLMREIYTDDEAANFSASLVRNMGVPGVVISPSNTVAFSDIDPEATKRAFMSKFGGDSKGEPLVLTEPTDVKVLSFNPQQMDLKALRRVPEERISGVLGIAASVAGLGAGLEHNTFTNYGEARKAAYEESVIPEQRLVSGEICVQLLPDFADTEANEYEVDFDLRNVRALQENVDAVWSRSRSAASAGLITRASFKRFVGEPVAADGSDDVYVFPSNYTVSAPGRQGVMTPDGRSLPPPGRAAATGPSEGVAA
jgi:HK97 family phage portal protein